jgi:hypothetical protein
MFRSCRACVRLATYLDHALLRPFEFRALRLFMAHIVTSARKAALSHEARITRSNITAGTLDHGARRDRGASQQRITRALPRVLDLLRTMLYRGTRTPTLVDN